MIRTAWKTKFFTCTDFIGHSYSSGIPPHFGNLSMSGSSCIIKPKNMTYLEKAKLCDGVLNAIVEEIVQEDNQ